MWAFMLFPAASSLHAWIASPFVVGILSSSIVAAAGFLLTGRARANRQRLSAPPGPTLIGAAAVPERADDPRLLLTLRLNADGSTETRIITPPYLEKRE
jgi:hypothetical protein